MTTSEQFDTELFILEIEEQAALWKSTLKEYSDKTVRKAMWEGAEIWRRGTGCGRKKSW
jgi:hypothetical protein